MNCRTRLSVSVSILPPARMRATNFPSFTASRPNVVSAIPRDRAYASISWIRVSELFMNGIIMGYIPYGQCISMGYIASPIPSQSVG